MLSTHTPQPRTTRQASPSRGLVAALGSLLCMFAVLALPCALPARVLAQAEADDATRAAARRLGSQGIEAYQADDFVTASDKLDRAFKLYTTTTLGLWSARARAQLGQLVEADERYREALRANIVGDADAQHKAQQEAREELSRLTPRIPTLTIRLQNAQTDDVVTLDDLPVPSALIGEARPTNPGKHILVAKRGAERQERQVVLLEGEQKQVSLELREALAGADLQSSRNVPSEPITLTPTPTELRSPTPAPEPRVGSTTAAATSPLKPIGIVTLAFGTASLATSGITALIANNKRGQCEANVCPPDVKQTYDGLRTVSTVAFYAGAGLALGGLVMWLAAPQKEVATTESLSWTVAPTGVGVHGVF